jgi:carboxylesterase type B
MNTFLLSNFPHLTQEQLITIDDLYPKAAQFPGTGAYWRTVSNAYGEMRYICPGINVSSVMANARVKVWNYRYNVRDPTNYAHGLGTTHTEEVSAIWGTQYVNGGAPASYNSSNYPMVPVIQGYWTSFIRAFDPNLYRAKGTPIWDGWTESAMKRLMFITNGTAMETAPSAQANRCEFLSGIAVSIQQ